MVTTAAAQTRTLRRTPGWNLRREREGAGSAGLGVGRPGNKLRRSCDWCASAKRRCDGADTCSECGKRGRTCHYSQRKKSGPKRVTATSRAPAIDGHVQPRQPSRRLARVGGAGRRPRALGAARTEAAEMEMEESDEELEEDELQETEGGEAGTPYQTPPGSGRARWPLSASAPTHASRLRTLRPSPPAPGLGGGSRHSVHFGGGGDGHDGMESGTDSDSGGEGMSDSTGSSGDGSWRGSGADDDGGGGEDLSDMDAAADVSDRVETIDLSDSADAFDLSEDEHDDDAYFGGGGGGGSGGGGFWPSDRDRAPRRAPAGGFWASDRERSWSPRRAPAGGGITDRDLCWPREHAATTDRVMVPAPSPPPLTGLATTGAMFVVQQFGPPHLPVCNVLTPGLGFTGGGGGGGGGTGGGGAGEPTPVRGTPKGADRLLRALPPWSLLPDDDLTVALSSF